MSEQTDAPTEGPLTRRWLWLGIGAVIVVAALIVWAVVGGAFSGEPSAGPSGSPTSGASASASPDASGEPDPSASASAEPEPTDEPGPRETKAPVDLDETAKPSRGLEASLVKIESVEGEAVIAGEVGGPSLRVTLEVSNDTRDAFATPAVVVNLYIGSDLRPAGPLMKPGGKEFPQSVKAGAIAEGVYLFNVPLDQRDDITIEVDLAVGTPIVVFHGSVS